VNTTVEQETLSEVLTKYAHAWLKKQFIRLGNRKYPTVQK